MRPSSGSRKVLLVVALIVAGCSGSSDNGMGNSPGPDSGVTRSMPKLDAALEAGQDGLVGLDTRAKDAPANDAPANDVPAKDAPAVDSTGDGADDVGDAPNLVPAITVEVDYQSLVPSKDGGVAEPLIVPSTYSPSPFVTVTVVSNSGNLKADEITTVTAAIFDPLVTTPVSTTKLARSDSRITPESNTVQFVFSGVPLDLSKLQSASYVIVFTATTVGGNTGQTKVTLAVDTGPVLTVKLPAEGGYYKGSAPIEVEATQSIFAITQATMALGQGEATPLTPVGAGLYRGNIDFAAFSPPLEGAQLATFRATNDNGTVATVLRHFISDNTGPTITDTSPVLGAMVGNVIAIKANVEDPAGVDSTSVIAVVGNGDQNFEVALVLQSGKTYGNLFDTTKLPSHTLYPTISFRARDKLGNESTTSYMLSLDNEPPLIDLDPGYVRMIRDDSVCSWPFDPVGPDAVDDGDLVTQLFDVRARIEDQGNTPLTGSTDFVLIGEVKPSSVKLYVIGNAKRPLVVDTTDPPDGICDDINPELVPTTKPETEFDAQVLDMVVLAPQGAPDYTPNPDSSCSTPAPESGEPASPPKAFCDTTENVSKALVDKWGHVHSDNMSYVIHYRGNDLPAIYTLGPIIGDGLQCAGRQFDASNNLKNGWACLAVKASDTLGNAQVSRPIRACVVSDPTQKGCADFRKLARLIPTSPDKPVEIVTSEPFLIKGAPVAAGTSVLITGAKTEFGVNGRWTVMPAASDSTGTRYVLQEAKGFMPRMCVCATAACTTFSLCPANPLTMVLTPGQPIVVQSTSPHGLVDGDSIEIFGNTEQAGVTGRTWKVTVSDANQFTLVGSVATAPVSPGGAMFVLVDENLPDCTGTLVKGGADGGRPLVDSTQPCKPWTDKNSFIHKR
jgi:hypothetical protein